MGRTRLRRGGIVGALTLAGLLTGVGVASAHVTVSPGQATQGGYATVIFQVPNEKPTAATVKVEISIPAATPIASVSYLAVPGWTAKAVSTPLPAPVTSDDTVLTEGVSSVTFTANPGTKIGTGEFGQFTVSVGPLPDIAAISFPTTQTYDDGTVVRWKDPPNADGSEPEHPAPTLTLAAATDHHHAGASRAVGTAVTTGPAITTDPQSAAAVARSDTAARILGVVGIIVGALGLLVGAIGLRRRDRTR